MVRDGPWIVASERFSSKYDSNVSSVEGKEACVQEKEVPFVEPTGMESTFQAYDVEDITSKPAFVDKEAFEMDVSLSNTT